MKHKLLACVMMVNITLAAVETSALAEKLDIKTGLWESTEKSQAQGSLPMPDEERKNLNAQQREMLEKMEGKLRQPHTAVFKSCITEKDLEEHKQISFRRPRHEVRQQVDQAYQHCDCGHKALYQTRPATTLDFDFVIHDREHVTGKISGTLTVGSRTGSTKVDLFTRWLSASCGNTQ